MPHELFDVGTPARAGEADRRTVRRVAAFGAAAVAATALLTAGVAQGAGTGSGPASAYGTDPGSPYAAPSASASSSASPSASAAAAAPQLRVQIAYNRVGRDLTLSFSFGGYVLEPLDAAGNKMDFPTPAKRDIGMGETLDWGDGTNSDVPISGRRCPVDKQPRTVHEIKDAYQAKKHYNGPGTYTINYTYFACGLTNGKISGTVTITIPK